jgi:hypothetical protein
MQAKHGRDNFIIIANHCQGGGADNTRSVWLKHQGGDQITVIDSGDLNGAQVSGIPRCFLFDHDGKLIFDGHPGEVASKVEDAVKRAPGHLVAGYTWSKLAKEAAAVGRMQGVGTVLKTVRKAAEAPATQEEAGELLRRIDAWQQEAQAELTAARGADPAGAYQIANRMAGLLKGDAWAKPFEDAAKELKADKGVQEAIKAADALAQVRAVGAKYGIAADPITWTSRASNKAKAQELATALATIQKRYAGTKAATEAAELAREWKLAL